MARSLPIPRRYRYHAYSSQPTLFRVCIARRPASMASLMITYIDRFLAPIDLLGTFSNIMEAVVLRAKADPVAEKAVNAIKEWLAKPLVSEEAEAQLQSNDVLAGDVSDRLLIGAPSVRLGLALGYLRAQEGLRVLTASGRYSVEAVMDQLPKVAESV
jgi:hypothetical protein